MTEYATTPSAVAEWRTQRNRTAEWVQSPPQLHPSHGLDKDVYLSASRAPSQDSRSEWDGNGWEPSDCESSHSVPPTMVLQYADGRGILVSPEGSRSGREKKEDLDFNLPPGAPISPLKEPSRKGSAHSTRTTTTAAARAAPLPSSMPSTASDQISPTRSHHSSHISHPQSNHSRTRSLSMGNAQSQRTQEDERELPPLPSAHPSTRSNGNAPSMAMGMTNSRSLSTSHSSHPEQIFIRPPAPGGSQFTHSGSSSHNPADYGADPPAGASGSLLLGTAHSGSLSYVTLPPTAQPMAYPQSQHSYHPTSGPRSAVLMSSQQGTPHAFPREIDMGGGTPRAHSRASTLQHGAHPVPPPLPPQDMADHDNPEASFVFVDPIIQPGGMGSSRSLRRSGAGSHVPSHHSHSNSFPPPTVPQHSVHAPPSLSQRYADRESYKSRSRRGEESHHGSSNERERDRHSERDRGIEGSSRSHRTHRSEERKSTRSRGSEGATPRSGREDERMRSERSSSRGSAGNPPSIVYAPGRTSRGHFSPPKILYMPSAHASQRASAAQQQLQHQSIIPDVHPGLPIAGTSQHDMGYYGHVGQAPMPGHAPASSVRRAHTISHHAPSQHSMNQQQQQRPPSQQSQRSRGHTHPPASASNSMGGWGAAGVPIRSASPGMGLSTSAPMPGGHDHHGNMVIPSTHESRDAGVPIVPRGADGSGAGYPTPPASASGSARHVQDGMYYGNGSVVHPAEHMTQNGNGSWGRASRVSKGTSKTKHSSKSKRPGSSASVGSLLMGRGGSRDGAAGAVHERGMLMSNGMAVAPAADRGREHDSVVTRGSAPGAAGVGTLGGGGLLSRLRDFRGRDKRQSLDIVSGSQRSIARRRGSKDSLSSEGSRSSASTYYVLPTAGQKVKIIVSNVLLLSCIRFRPFPFFALQSFSFFFNEIIAGISFFLYSDSRDYNC